MRLLQRRSATEAVGIAVFPLIAAVALGALLSLLVFNLRLGEVGRKVALADALFVSGALQLSLAGLIYTSRMGGFDVFAYSFSALIRAILGHRSGSYADFKKGRARPEPRPALAILGLGYILASLFFILA